MSINTATVDIAAEDGKSMGLYVAAPDGDGRKPALLVIMEIFGVNAHMKDVTDRFANEGYVAISPDLYYRLDERVIPNTDRDGAFAARGTLYDTKVIEDLNRAIAYAKGRDDVDPDKVGIIGYCFGGRVSWMAACNCPGLAASSLYYGGQIAGGQRGEKSPVEPVTQGNNIRSPCSACGAGRTRASRRRRGTPSRGRSRPTTWTTSGTCTRTPATRSSATTARATTRRPPGTSGPRLWRSWAGT